MNLIRVKDLLAGSSEAMNLTRVKDRLLREKISASEISPKNGETASQIVFSPFNQA